MIEREKKRIFTHSMRTSCKQYGNKVKCFTNGIIMIMYFTSVAASSRIFCFVIIILLCFHILWLLSISYSLLRKINNQISLKACSGIFFRFLWFKKIFFFFLEIAIFILFFFVNNQLYKIIFFLEENYKIGSRWQTFIIECT